MSPAPQAVGELPALDPKGAARRRFTRAGLGAGGVILTLHSQPGMAAGSLATCASPSGFMSIKTASHNPANSCSNNRSHGYWKTHSSAWKSRTGTSPTTRFADVLAARGSYSGLKNFTLLEILEQPNPVKAIDRNNVAMQIVTALLNARSSAMSGIPSVLAEDKVVAIWDEFSLKGSYRPTGSATPWTGAQLAAYLETTFR
ncbi:hypothetical protein [Massilia sp. Se16.2.3]|nr:hypothetical protein [Massilia sp. Se16.2.3]QNA98050.1 hypothetical protein G4G31_03140 [Massilia sp. Se16.2.3]